MVARCGNAMPLTPGHWRQRADLCGFQTSLLNRVSSRIMRALKRDTVSKSMTKELSDLKIENGWLGMHSTLERIVSSWPSKKSLMSAIIKNT